MWAWKWMTLWLCHDGTRYSMWERSKQNKKRKKIVIWSFMKTDNAAWEKWISVLESFCFVKDLMFGTHTVFSKTVLICTVFFINNRRRFLDRIAHTNHEISTRLKFKSVLWEAWYGFLRINFHHSQTYRFLVGYCEKGLTQKNMSKRNTVWGQAVSGD